MNWERIRQEVRQFPDQAGVYLMKDAEGQILYIGKAGSLKKRVSSYFQNRRHHSPLTDRMLNQVRDVEYLETGSESEALLVESSLIKRYQPRYNVEQRDDKSYPYLKLTRNEKFPRLLLTRDVKNDDSVYFGPYTNVKLLRQALAFMRRTFPLRTCRVLPRTACLQYYIGQCVAPCIDKATQEEYQRIVKETTLFLEGKKDELIQQVSERMQTAAAHQEFEQAAQARDQLYALSTTITQSTAREVKNLFAGDVTQEKYHKRVIYRVDELMELKDLVGINKIPRRIEAFDVSAIFGAEAVASMVSFLNGEADKNQYRRFRIKFFQGVMDDYQMIREVITRRYERVLREGHPLPDLVLVDGGKGQVSAAREVLDQLGLREIPVIGLAKRLERVALSKVKEYISLPKDSRVLRLLQRIRNEAHRFAITYHRLLRQKKLIGVDK